MRQLFRGRVVLGMLLALACGAPGTATWCGAPLPEGAPKNGTSLQGAAPEPEGSPKNGTSLQGGSPPSTACASH